MLDTLQHLFHYAWSFALVISMAVFIHEGGHFLAARLCGVRVETFSIGFGREVLGRTDRHGTRWKIALLPLGGYVKMYGDAGAASTPDTEKLAEMTLTQKRESFHFRPLWAKAIIVAAGPFANFLLAIVVFTYFIFTSGLDSTEPVVGSVMENTPAASAGIQAGDHIVRVDDTEIHYFKDISGYMMTSVGNPVTLTIDRAGEVLTIVLTPQFHTDDDVLGNGQKRLVIGIKSQKLTYRDVGLPAALVAATARTVEMCRTTLRFLGQIISGTRGTEDLRGPLGIAKLSGDVTHQGTTTSETLQMVLWFVALLSVNLGLMNLLPVPMLDGGHLLFYSVEAMRGRPMAQRVMEYSYRLGTALIIGLMGVSFYNDVKQIFLS